MFKTLLRLAPLALAGYTLYRIISLLSREQLAARRAQQFAPAPQAPFDRTRLTGPGEGMTETTEDPAGTSVPHRVGRGVVQR